MYFTGIIDTFCVMLIQIMLMGSGRNGTDIAWWMEPAYLISFMVYLIVYLHLLKKNEVYLCDIGFKYQAALLIQGSIFQMFYDFVFASFHENHAMYGWDAYILFLLVWWVYFILTLGLAINNILSNRQNKELQSFMQNQQKTEAVKADVPRIRVEYKKEIFIVVRNSVGKRANTKTDFFMTSKQDKENHGFGLKNIVAAVEKYHGEYYMESIVEDGEALFKISIAIPREQKQ